MLVPRGTTCDEACRAPTFERIAVSGRVGQRDVSTRDRIARGVRGIIDAAVELVCDVILDRCRPGSREGLVTG